MAAEELKIDPTNPEACHITKKEDTFTSIYITISGFFTKNDNSDLPNKPNLIGWEELIETSEIWFDSWQLAIDKEITSEATVMKIGIDKIDRIIGLFKFTAFKRKNPKIEPELEDTDNS